MTVVASFSDTFVLLVHYQVRLACQTFIAAAGCASSWTSQALFPLFVAIITVRTAVETFSIQRESTWLAENALRVGRTVAGQTRWMASGAVGIFSFVSLLRTGCKAFIFVQDEMMFTASAVVWSILARRAIGFARYTSFVFVVCKKFSR